MKKIKKLIFLLAVIAVAFVCIVIINFVKLDVSYYDIKNVKLPEDFNGYKIVQISDWHGRKPDERVTNKIREENPDIIVITGDFVDRFFTDTKNAGKMISQIKDIAPVYYVSGNHEAQNNNYDDFKQYLYSENITVLDNKSVIITKGSGKIRLAGVDDPFFYEGFEHFDLSFTENDGEGDIYTILLSHRPEYIEDYSRENIDLVLSGHAHGGLIRLPWIGGLTASGQGLFPKYTEGVYHAGNTDMVVSRGLGDSIVPVRINNNRELVIITLNKRK